MPRPFSRSPNRASLLSVGLMMHARAGLRVRHSIVPARLRSMLEFVTAI